MRIQVTADDIKHGIRRDAHGCMVARAIKRQTKAIHVEVGTYININSDTFQIIPRVMNKIIQFDNNLRVTPFSFDLVPLVR